MLCALIMAGGKGTRFWPLSTEKKPKQFLNLLGEYTMIQMTVNRIKGMIPMERIFVVTGKIYEDLVKEQLPELPKENIIIEPFSKNTAPCIALSALTIKKKFDNATIAVLPSDHLILDEEKFRKALTYADEFVDKNKSAIVTIGMKPDRPETEYGYIKVINNLQYRIDSKSDNLNILKVEKFEEKPDKEIAEKYMNDVNYLWNCGIFIWKAMNVIKLTKIYLKNTFDALTEIAAAESKDYESVLKDKYQQVDNISVDYGIMEKADNIYVIPGDFGWDDVGTWNAIERYREKDSNNNVFIGNVKSIEGKNNLIVGRDKPIITVGLDNIFAVETNDVILLCKKENLKYIKEIKEKIC